MSSQTLTAFAELVVQHVAPNKADPLDFALTLINASNGQLRKMVPEKVDALNRAFWELSILLREIKKRHAYRDWGYESFKAYLSEENPTGHSVSWGMLAEQASRVLVERVTEYIPADDKELYLKAVSYMSFSMVQEIVPEATRLLSRADGRPRWNDPEADLPITHREAASKVADLIVMADAVNDPEEVKEQIGSSKTQIVTLTKRQIRVDELTPKQREEWGLTDKPDYALIGLKLWMNPAVQPPAEGKRSSDEQGEGRREGMGEGRPF